MRKLFNLVNISPVILILTIGVFGIINTEMGVVGILPLIAKTFNVSVPSAGLTVSIFAIVVAISGPVMPLLFSSVNRKTTMLLALGVFIVSNIISIFTNNFTLLLAARALPAFFHPVYVSMAFSMAAASVSKQDAPKAVSKVFIGVSAGMVLGVPVTSIIASESSFKTAMAFFAIVNAAVFIATIFYVPSAPVKQKLSYGSQLAVLQKSKVWYSILGVTFINGAVFGFFSFMSDYLSKITNVSFKVISILLFIYGMANIAGNLLGGKMLSKNAPGVIKATPLALGGLYILLFITGKAVAPVILIILLLGIAAGIAVNGSQYMLANAAPEAPDFANGLFLTSANLGTAAGTALCGMFISAAGTQNVLAGSAVFLALGMFFILLRQYSGSIKQTPLNILKAQ